MKGAGWRCAGKITGTPCDLLVGVYCEITPKNSACCGTFAYFWIDYP